MIENFIETVSLFARNEFVGGIMAILLFIAAACVVVAGSCAGVIWLAKNIK